jgi:hypothetical protein
MNPANFGVIIAKLIAAVKQFSGRGIIKAKPPEPGGESIWSADG